MVKLRHVFGKKRVLKLRRAPKIRAAHSNTEHVLKLGHWKNRTCGKARTCLWKQACVKVGCVPKIRAERSSMDRVLNLGHRKRWNMW